MTSPDRGAGGEGLAAGTRLGPYEIVGLLGAGGMGDVYRARDTRLGRDVAVKVLPPELAGDRDRLRRFEQEARAVAALSHPNILAIHDVGTHAGAPYLVTELLEGETLRARLEGGALAPRRAIDLGVQIAEGLAAAHEKGIVHRDLKPGNVFVTTDGHAKILDFGLAKTVVPSTAAERVAATTMEEATDAGRVIGTAAYMSPEQVRGVPVDHRSDLFSLGVVLYEMATGRQAFARDSTTETMAAILKEEPPDPSSVSAVVPLAFSRAIAHCLEKRPEERFQTARDLAFELKAVLSDSTGPRREPRRVRRRWAIAVGSAILVLATGLAVGLRLVRPPGGKLTATNFRLISTFPGSHRWPTFSPDGSMIAFVSDAGGSPQIWVLNLAGGDPIRITSGNLNPSHPSWSPRNDQIVFEGGEELTGHGIWSVPPLGGTPRRIVENALAPSFSVDGRKLAFQMNLEGIFICNADGSGRQRLANLAGDMLCDLDDGPVFSPDGKMLAIYPALSGRGDLWALPLDGGKPRRLTSDDVPGGHPVWARDGSSLIFSSARTGSRNLWRIAAKGGRPEPLTTGAGDDDELALSPDGHRLVYTSVRNSHALMVLDPATGESREVLCHRTPVALPSLSPAGDWLAFSARGFGGGDVYLVARDGTRLRQVSPASSQADCLLNWSGDGRSLFFLNTQTEKASFCRLPVGGGPPVELPSAWAPHGTWSPPTFSPDGQKVAYSVAETGRPAATFVHDLVADTTTKLSEPLDIPCWSHDGRFLVGQVLEGMPIFVCPPTADPCTRVGTSEGVQPFWTHDDSSILFVLPSKDPPGWEVRVVRPDGSGERVVGVLPSLEIPLGLPRGISSRDEVPWVQLRSGRHELWMADLQG